jgi:hypothetical protein
MFTSCFRILFAGCSDYRALAEVFKDHLRELFLNLGTVQTAAEVFNDVTEWTSLKSNSNEMLELITTTDILQRSIDIDYDMFAALASLTITLGESIADAILEPFTPINARLLEIMLLLLDSDVSIRTFTFWVSFAEASVDVGDGRHGEPWLERALPILLQKSAWRDIDPDEWIAYRMDVVEMFEGICEVLGHEKINSVVLGCLENAARCGALEERMIVAPR